MKKIITIIATLFIGVSAFAQFSDDYTHFSIGKFQFAADQDMEEILENGGGLYRYTGFKDDVVPFYERTFCNPERLSEVAEENGVVFTYVDIVKESTFIVSIYIRVFKLDKE